MTNKFNIIKHNGTFCKCTKIRISGDDCREETQELDFCEYLALLYHLNTELQRLNDRAKTTSEYDYTCAGYFITDCTVDYINPSGYKRKDIYRFYKFNSAAK